MSKQRPRRTYRWSPPEGHVVVGRRWKYAPPPWVMFEALTDERDRWISLLTGELEPKVAAYKHPVYVVFRPWVDPVVSAVEVRMEPDEGSGAALTVLAYADQPELPPEERRWVCYRLGSLFGAALRDWVDEPRR